MEVGNIVFSHVVQKGYVKAAGQEVYREDYPSLYQFALENELLLNEEDWANDRQGMYSLGDGHMTFRLPDLRGQFLRALDDNAGQDVGRVIGSRQSDAIRNIIGEVTLDDNMNHRVSPSGAFHTVQSCGARHATGGDYGYRVRFNASRVVPTAEENRPKNIALIAQIKY